jgi:phospho-2-dehydro-3-deoxyheptonate aldolase
MGVRLPANIEDPDMNGSYQINRGLKIARKLLLDITEIGLPAAGEFLGQLILQASPAKLTS